MTMTVAADPPAVVPLPPTPANFGSGYISDVTSTTNCFYSDTNGGGIQFWDIQAGGTYTITLSGVTDCANQGNDPSIGVVVHNETGGNIYKAATQTGDQGVYTFTITLTTQCLTMPIEYCTNDGSPEHVPGNYPGSGIFAQDNVGGVAGGHQGHLRTTIFDSNCVAQGDDTSCQGGTQPTGTITACKFYDKNASGIQDAGEPTLNGWPFCIDPLDNAIPQLVTQTNSSGNCVSWSNLTFGSYQIREANANESNWFHSSPASLVVAVDSTTPSRTLNFGNYCTQPSGGLTMGFWSNKNGNKLLTNTPAGNGQTLIPDVVALLNACSLRNADGSVHSFTSSYSAFKTWLMGATATNMSYMLSAQLAALKLDVYFGFVDGNAYDLCSDATVNGLITAACGLLTADGHAITGDPNRTAQEHLKNCIDAINNNGAVIPVLPCSYTFPNPPAPCP